MVGLLEALSTHNWSYGSQSSFFHPGRGSSALCSFVLDYWQMKYATRGDSLHKALPTAVKVRD